MKAAATVPFAVLFACLSVVFAHAETIKSGHVLGNGTASEREPSDTSLGAVMAQPGSGVSALLGAASHVPTNAALATAPATLYPTGVWRDDYAIGLGAPPTFYQPIASPCSLNSGAGDNGSQVRSSDGKCWLATGLAGGPVWASVWGVVGDNATNNYTALSNVIAWMNANNNCKIELPAGDIQFSSALPAITSQGCALEGQGRDHTFLIHTGTSGNSVTLTGYAINIRHLTFQPLNVKTSGCELEDTGSFTGGAEDVDFVYAFEPICDISSTELEFRDIGFRYTLGSIANFYFAGTVSAPAFRVKLDNLIGDNPYPYAEPTSINAKAYTTSTAYNDGDIVRVNGYVWQALNIGTSAASSPTFTPCSTTAACRFQTSTNYILDNNIHWGFVFTYDASHITQDSYAYSMVIDKAGLIDFGQCFTSEDTANTGTSFPVWLQANDLECDHNYNAGVSLNAGSGHVFINSWFSSSLTNSEVVQASTYLGESTFSADRIAGAAQHGMVFNSGKFIVTNDWIGTNSASSSGTYHGITVGPNVSGFTITGIQAALPAPAGTETQGYEVLVNSGTSNYYTITGVLCQGVEVIGCVSDGGSGASKTVSGNW